MSDSWLPSISRGAACLLALSYGGAHAVSYELIDLSALRSPDGYAIHEVTGINGNGEIVGSAHQTGRMGAPLRAFRLRGIELQLLGQPEGATAGAFSKAGAINNAGAVAGYAEVAGRARPVIWHGDAAPHVLEVPARTRFASGSGINDKGIVTGSLDLDGNNQAFHWADGNLTRIAPIAADPKGLSFSHGHRVGENGAVVGRSSFEYGSIAFVWMNGQVKALPPLPEHAKLGAEVSVYGINSAGVAVGCSSNGPAKSTVPVLWMPDGAVTRLFDVRAVEPGALYGCAKAINNQGVIVGETWGPGAGGAFAWEHRSGYRNLNDLADAGRHGWKRLESAVAINDRGEIIGTARADPLPGFASFLLRPCDGWICWLDANRKWVGIVAAVTAGASVAAIIAPSVRRRRRRDPKTP